MKDVTAVTAIAILAIAAVLGITWLFAGNDLAMYRYFAPKMEQTRRTTFEQSKAYRQGMVQELQNMMFEYMKATPDQKAALASVILHRAADFDEDAMPADLRSMVDQLRHEQVQ